MSGQLTELSNSRRRIGIRGLVATLAFLVAVTFHVTSYFPPTIFSIRNASLLHLVCLVLFGTMVFSISWQKKQMMSAAFKDGRRDKSESENIEKAFEKKALRFTPSILKLACAAIFIYTIINFLIFMANNEGTARIEEGQFVLKSRAKFIRFLTEDEYYRELARELRGMSGHWMLFSIVPMTYFLFVNPKLNEEYELAQKPSNV